MIPSNALATFIFIFFLSGETATIDDAKLFDFWVGEWNLTWTNADGTTGKGFNKIEKILDGKVIRENFEDNSGFKGTSISVYNSSDNTWHQAWADNQGGYFDLEGAVDGEKRIFKTKVRDVGGKKIIQRMVFYEIGSDSLKWDWEKSEDNGATWTLQWRVFYSRAKK